MISLKALKEKPYEHMGTRFYASAKNKIYVFEPLPAYASQEILENEGAQYLDKDRHFIAKFGPKNHLGIWSLIGGYSPNRKTGCVKIYEGLWNPENQETIPFNRRLEEMLRDISGL